MTRTQATQQDDILRIMISTDNHLGVWEKDEGRKHDSFQAFNEVLEKAVEMDVDLVLLGGDLFHENKPSRTTVVKTITALKTHCQPDKPVKFHILSEQSKNFVSGVANTEDPTLHVGLPVFTIHGNHDDPSGADNLSAVDILSTCGLVNYFGKVFISGGNPAQTAGRVEISPVMIAKGATKVALYGLGNIRDERLGRMFNTPGSVEWKKPRLPGEAANSEDWFNIFVLHQNRVQHGPQAKSNVLESMLPTWLDFVVWGHEHECKPNADDAKNPLAAGPGTVPVILQPGSTVATALTEGEAQRKHCFILEIMQDKWRMTKHALNTQRPFVYETVALRDVRQPKVLHAEDPDGIAAFLESKVGEMITKAASQHPDTAQPMLPLIRLKVDYTGFSTINAQRFGQKFVGRVANPHDMLTWTKAMPRKTKDEGGGGELGEGMSDADLLRPDLLDQARIEDLIKENLTDQLKLLREEDLADALHQFVDKDEKGSLAECVVEELTLRLRAPATRKVLVAEAGTDQTLKEGLMAAVQEDKQSIKESKLAIKANAGEGGARASTAGVLEDDGMHDEIVVQPAKGRASKAAAARGGKATGRAAAGAGRGKAKAATGKQPTVMEMFAASQQATTQRGAASARADTVEETDEFEEEDGFSKGRKGVQAAAPKGRGRGKTTPAATPTPKRARKVSSRAVQDDDDDDAIEDHDAPSPPSTQPAGRRSSRAAAVVGSKRSRAVAEDEADEGVSASDDEYVGGAASSEGVSDDDIIRSDEELPGAKAKGRKAPAKKGAAGGPAAKRARAANLLSPATGPGVRGTKATYGQDDVVDLLDSEDDQVEVRPTPALAHHSARQGTITGSMRPTTATAGSTQQGATPAGPGPSQPARAGGRALPASMGVSTGAATTSQQRTAGGTKGNRGWGQAR